jgi:SSS family solute:Na+ symporter
MHPLLSAKPADYAVLITYFLFVIGIGVVIGRKTKTSEEFFLSGRSIPAWVTGLAFISANLGALEVLGMASQGAEYGMMTAHFYWIGAIPAMVFLGVAMMPFYYGSKVRSVPEYLKRRYNEPTRFLNAITFAISTLVLSGVNMYAMGLVFHDLIGWNINTSIWLAAGVVLIYTTLGGLTSSIYNEVLQFFLIVLGIVPIVIIGMIAVHGWHGLAHAVPNPGFMHTWAGTGSDSTNNMHITWPGIVLGLGFVLSFGYWCTDFLVIQRALAAKDLSAAQRTPLIAAFPKIFFPFIVILPGLLAISLFPQLGHDIAHHPENSYNNALPLLMAKYYPPGLLGLGLTALLASFMSGMAGNVTAFNTVFTYDLYSVYISKDRSDQHYLRVGRLATIFGVLASVATAYLAASAPSVMDFTQTVFGFVNAPLLGTFLFGMFWKRTSAWGGFWGLVVGISAAIIHYVMTVNGTIHFSTDQAGNFWRAFIAFAAGAIATFVVSLVTQPPSQEQLTGLVYGQAAETTLHQDIPVWQRPAVLAVVILVITAIVNICVW